MGDEIIVVLNNLVVMLMIRFFDRFIVIPRFFSERVSKSINTVSSLSNV